MNLLAFLPTAAPIVSSLRRRLLWVSALALPLFSTATQAAGPLPVMASFSILGDLVQVVGGDKVRVTCLVGPDQDAHVFEPKPRDAKALLESKLLVMNGLGFEPWAGKLLPSAGYRGATVVATQGVNARVMHSASSHDQAHTQGQEPDPHAWQAPNNVILYVRNIAAGLSKLDPVNASYYQANAQAYTQKLQALDAWAASQVLAIPAARRKVITSHDAFGYLAARYGITFLAPQGISTEVEPSAKQVAQLIRQIQRDKIRAVFLENMSSPQLIARLSNDAGATLGATLYADALSAAQQPGATYLQLMQHNITQLVAGMKLN